MKTGEGKMKKIFTVMIIALLIFPMFSMFSLNVYASVTVMPTRLPDVRSYASAVWDGSNAYVFGGASLSGPSNQILKYNPASDTISVMSATLPDPLCDMPAVWTGGYAYLFGGYVAPLHTSNKIVRYDPLADTITVMGAVLPTYAYPVYSMSAIWDGNAAYLFGGYDGYAYFDHILKYDPVLDQITTMSARLPTGIKWMSAVWTGHHAYVFGGRTSSGVTNQIVKYNPALDTMTSVSATLPESVYATSAVWTGTYAYIFGGRTMQNVDSAKIFKYDPALDSCSVVGESLPSPRAATCAVWDGDSAFIFGGELAASATVCDEIVRFSPVSDEGTVSLPWRDDFNYNTKDEMKVAGWSLEHEELINVGGGVLTLDDDGSVMARSFFRGHFAPGIYDFKVEAKGKWTGRVYGSLLLFVITERHNYMLHLDGYYPNYAFVRDRMEDEIRFGGYVPQFDTWLTMGFEKRGNTIVLYNDDNVVYTFIDPDGEPNGLVGVGIASGWISTNQYDHISVTEAEAPPPSVSISPLSASILVGQSVTFTSAVSGGYVPYSYQWYLGGNPVSGATSNSWTFTLTTSGVYYVYLKVTDTLGNITQSETACMTTSLPVGGYSVSLTVHNTPMPSSVYLALLIMLSAVFTTVRRKTCRKK